MAKKAEALKKFEQFALRNFQCLSGGENLNYSSNLSFRPSLEILENCSKF